MGASSDLPRERASVVRSSILFGVAVLGCSLVVGVWIGSTRAGGSKELAGEARPAVGGEPGAPPEVVDARIPASAQDEAGTGSASTEEPRRKTAREFLSAYYGERWPELEARIEASGMSLDVPYDFTPWEDVEQDFSTKVGMSVEDGKGVVRSLLRWPDEVTHDFVRAEFHLGQDAELDDSDLVAIESIVVQKNQEIVQLAQYFVDLTDTFIKDRWRTGNFLKSPYTTAGLSDQRGYHSQSHGGRGWAVTITLPREEYPEIDELEGEIFELDVARNELVHDYLRTRPMR